MENDKNSAAHVADQAQVKPKRRLWRKLGLSFGMICVAFIFFEVALAKEETTFSIDTDPHYDRHERYYYPNKHRKNPWVKEGEDTLKIALVGDSFTNGSGVPYQDKYGVRLEALLNLNNDVPPGATKHYAKAGTSTYAHYSYIKHTIEWGADVVVLGICLNDAEDHQNNKTHSAWRAGMLPRVPTGFMKRLTGWSNIAAYAYTKKEVARAMKAHEAYYQKLYQEDYMGYKKFVGYLGEIKKDLDAHDIHFFVVVWPLLGDLNAKTYPHHDIHAKIHDVLDGYQIQYLDLLSEFLGKSSTRLQAVPFIDGHPSEIGHRMAAEALYRALLDNSMIPEVYRCEHTSGLNAPDYSKLYELMNPTNREE
jgi:hypothetical protein